MAKRLETPEEKIISSAAEKRKKYRWALKNKTIRGMAKERLGGKTLEEIGTQYGLTRQRVHQVMNSDEAKELVRREQLRLVGSVPTAVDNMVSLVNGFSEAKDKKLGYDASKEVLRTAGMLPVPNNSQTTITQIFSQQNVVASPIIEKFLSEHVKKLRWDGDSVDAEEMKDAG